MFGCFLTLQEVQEALESFWPHLAFFSFENEPLTDHCAFVSTPIFCRLICSSVARQKTTLFFRIFLLREVSYCLLILRLSYYKSSVINLP